jgi:hypothetical protein
MNMRWRKGRGVGHPAGALALADEAEAFLSGTYASLLRDGRGSTLSLTGI